MDNMKPAELEAVIKFSRAGLSALAERCLTWAAMLWTGAMFGYASFTQGWVSLAAACAFGLLVLWPIISLEKKAKE